MNTRLFFTFLLLSLGLQAQISQTERDALIAFYNATGGQNWTNNSGWDTNPSSTSDVSTWHGVTVLEISGIDRVAGISLPTNNLQGSLPDLIDLPFLQSLNVSENSGLTGSFDTSSYTSQYLSTLNVSDTGLSSLKLHKFVSINIKNTPNLFCVEVPQDKLTNFYNLSFDNFDFGDTITDDCNGVLPLDTTDKTAIEALYTATDGDTWSSRTYASTIINENNDTKGFSYVNVGAVRKFEDIRLVGMSLKGALPTEIGNFSELKNLHLYQNQLTTMPVELGNLPKLENLHLNNNPFTALVNEIGNISTLLHLNINSTQIELLPTTIGNLTNLTYLNFGSTKITLIPPQIGTLTNLTNLVAAPNDIASLPTELGDLTKLTYLDLSNCKISNTPASFANLTNLETLYLNNNQLQVVAGLGGFTKLKHLRLHNNRLGEDNPNFNTDLPEDMSNLVLLEELTLYSNQLTKLPTNIGNLVKLTSLQLHSNRLTSLPSTIGGLTNLQELYLYSNKLSVLPSTIGSLTSLKKFSLYNNELTSLPDEIGDLSNLEELNIGSHSKRENNATIRTLTSLPSSLNKLTKLVSLSAPTNNISGLVDLSSINTLRTIYLQDNEISDLKLGNTPTTNTSYLRYNITQNPFITCVEVPTNQITNWENRIQKDNGVAVSDSCTGYRVPQSEREALIAIYNATGGGTDWTGTNWDTDPTRLTNVGSWAGVVTELVNGQKHVVELIFTGHDQGQFKLRGEIPSDIKDLPELRKLDIGYNYRVDNKVTKVAKEIGQLQKLTHINFQRNVFTTLPTEIGDLPVLEELNLQENQITSLPSGIGNFQKLKRLILRNQNTDTNGNANLVSLPDAIGNISTLEYLDLSSNGLTSLPSTIGGLTNLQELYLYNNVLESLPNSFGDLINLRKLDVRNNRVEGYLNFNKLELLYSLNLRFNNISGIKLNLSPTAFGGNNGNYVVNFRRNALGCIEVPSDELVSWQLANINEENNYIDNGVIYSDNCANVTTNSIPQSEREALIALYNNTQGNNWKNDLSTSYDGVTWVADATKTPNVGAWFGVTTEKINGQKHVTKIVLNNNQLKGAIPAEIKNLTQLKELQFNSNIISEIHKDMSMLPKLERLEFSSQRDATTNIYPLTTLPAELNDITTLKRLNISGNRLEGNLDFSNLTNITSLSLSSNEITGLKLGIAPSVFDNTNTNGYSNNFGFHGNQYLYCIAVPQNTITDWQNSTYASSYPNIVWGDDCTAYNNVPQGEIQALVDMYNDLDGANWTNNTNWTGSLAKATANSPYNATKWHGITTKIVNGGKHITKISLGSNKLKGMLPSSFGNLTELKNIQLQSNELSGDVPTSFGNLTQLETLYLNNNQLTSLPTSLQNAVNLKTVYLSSNELEGKLPNFTGATNLATLYIQNNKLQFGDFEDEFTHYQTNVNSFSYGSQAKVGEAKTENIGAQGITLEAMVSGTNNTYQWYKNYSPINGATQATYTISNASSSDDGSYYCRVKNTVVTNLTIETERIQIVYDSALSIEDVALAKSVSLYPNPVSEVLNISIKNDTTIENIRVFNVLGKQVKEFIKPTKQVSFENLPSGMYVLQVQSEKGIITKKIVKQ